MQLFARLCELQEQDLVRGVGPTQHEMEMLDKALSDFERDGDHGLPWREVMREIRSSGRL